ncbi:MAG: HEPN domain-containing protein [Bacilli bacterium]|nr:HEPN domain-containing protein [Bacilli bacterium]
MLASTYYEKALSNFKTAKILFRMASNDEEQLNMAAYHIEQSIEFAITYILSLHGKPFQKTHDLDQLINYAESNNIDLYLPEYLKDKADVISLWETKTRYIIGFKVELNRIEKALLELENYFEVLSSIEEL